jgi:hypothetical protein
LKVIDKTPDNKFPMVNKFGTALTKWFNKQIPPF